MVKDVPETENPKEGQNDPTSIFVIIKKQIEELFQKLRDIADRLLRVESGAEMSSKEQKSIKENVSNVDKRLNDLELMVRDVKKSSDTPVDVLELDKRIANNEEQMAFVDKEVKSLSATTKTFDSRLLAIETKIVNQNPSQPSLESCVSKEVERRISEIEEEISLLKSKKPITDNPNTSTYEERLRAVETSIRAIRGTVDDNIKCSNGKDEEILSLKENITSLNEKLKTQEKTIVSLKSEISRLNNPTTEVRQKDFGLGDCIMVSIRRLFSLFK